MGVTGTHRQISRHRIAATESARRSQSSCIVSVHLALSRRKSLSELQTSADWRRWLCPTANLSTLGQSKKPKMCRLLTRKSCSNCLRTDEQIDEIMDRSALFGNGSALGASKKTNGKGKASKAKSTGVGYDICDEVEDS